MEQTTFYIVGGALVVLALAVSAVGLRFADFPRSRAALAAALALVAIAVVATTTAAVVAARDEQQHRRAEKALEQVEHP